MPPPSLSLTHAIIYFKIQSTKMSDGTTIRDAAIPVRAALLECISSTYLKDDEWVEDLLADFTIWAVGAGACALGKPSLDDRLANNMDIREVVANMLCMLRIVILQLHSKGKRLPRGFKRNYVLTDNVASSYHVTDFKNVPASTRTNSDNVPGPEKRSPNRWELYIEKEKINAASILAHVLKLTVAIKNAGNQSRIERFDGRFDQSNHLELKKHLTFLFLVRPTRDDLQTLLDRVCSLDLDSRSTLSEVQARLIEANLRRRNRFAFAYGHVETLARLDEADDEKGLAVLGAVDAVNAGPGPLTTATAPTATGIDGPITVLASNKSRRSVLSSTNARVQYPKPPEPQTGKTIIQCPRCCKAISETMKRPNL